MRIAVIGVGGTGGYFGGLLARAGEDVSFIGRGAQLAAIQRDGLAVRSQTAGDFTVPVRATATASEVGPVDLILVCTKTYDLESTLAHLPALVGPETMVLSVQNGIDNEDRIAAVIGVEHVLGAQAQIVTTIAAPGVIAQSSPSAALVLGELHPGSSPRAERLVTTLRQAGITAELRTDGRVHLWEKFVAICAMSGMTSLMRLPLGPIFACPEAVALFHTVLDEVVAVGQASGVPLAAGLAEATLHGLAAFATAQPAASTSMQRDLVAGKRLELDGLNGTAVRLGREHGVATPANAVIYAALKPYAGGAPDVPVA
jgi:2-dehydropantoate 2-reductase